MTVAAESRYPRKFEIHRLEALGDDPYYGLDEARERFADGRLLTVLPGGDATPWSMSVAANTFPFAGTHRFSLTWYTPRRTPLRQVTWETLGDVLVCRDSIDVFYPDGDPGGRVPFAHVITVEQTFAVDGVRQVTLSSPLEDETTVEIVDAEDAALRIPVLEFGDWAGVVAASAPTDEERFGIDTLDTSRGFLDRCIAQGRPADPGEAWRVPFDARGTFEATTAILDGRAPGQGVVLDRGPVRIIPLAAQGGDGAAEGRDPGEDRRRITRFAGRIRGAFEHHHGAQIHVDLTLHGSDTLAGYATSLRSAGAASAVWWGIGSAGVVLVTTGDAHTGDLALALHVVPLSWVSDRRAHTDGERTTLTWSIEDLRR